MPVNVTPELREFIFRYDARAPLEAEGVAEPLGARLVRERLGYSSINLARVPAVLTYDRATPAPRPVLIIQHGLHSSKDDPRLGDLAAAWASYGFACVTIDAPLHGERAAGSFDVMALLAQPYTGMRFRGAERGGLAPSGEPDRIAPGLGGGADRLRRLQQEHVPGRAILGLQPRLRAAVLAWGGRG